MNFSLRQLLLFSLLSASMLISGITAYLNYKVTRDEVADLFDAELAQSAGALDGFVRGFLNGESLLVHWQRDQEESRIETEAKDHYSVDMGAAFDNTRLLDRGLNLNKISEGFVNQFDELIPQNLFRHKYERKIVFQLLSKTGDLLLRSNGAPAFSLSSVYQGFSKRKIDGHLWRVYSISNPDGQYVIHVGQTEEVRSELADEISRQMLIQFLLSVPVLGIVIWFLVGYYLKPITLLERAVAKREANYLKPLSVRKLPKEIVPVVNEINSLFGQLEQALEHERRFTADASHELRTPLAGLLTQVQVALRTKDEEMRKQALKRIEQAVNRMTYMVQQLLTFSRIESNAEYLSKNPALISHEVVSIITDLEREAHRKRIRLEFDEYSNQPIVVNAPLINIMIRNLVDNAIKYTPHDGIIKVSIFEQDHGFWLTVEDSGPGIPPDQYSNSLKRFHRCMETAHQAQGSGLGFSIVSRIAALHNADLDLGTSKFGGLKVSVRFPLPEQTNPEIKSGFFFSSSK